MHYNNNEGLLMLSYQLRPIYSELVKHYKKLYHMMRKCPDPVIILVASTLPLNHWVVLSH